MRRSLFAALALATGVAVSNAGQQSYGIYDVVVRDAKDARILGDSPVLLVSEDIEIGLTRIAVQKGQEWQLMALRLPVTFVDNFVAETTGPATGVADGADYRNEYLNLDTLYAEYENLRATYPHLVERTQIGLSIQNRPLYAYRIFRQDLQEVAMAPKSMVLVGGTHAREWISPAVTLHVAKMLTETLATVDDAFTDRFVDQVAVWVVPTINPDGYSYTWTNNRMWRKNRRLVTGSTYGVDLNRNYSTNWGGEGSSGTPSSDIYRGTAPFSEPETNSLRNFVNTLSPKKFFIDFHSYGQKVLYPWSYTTTAAPHAAYMNTVGNAFKTAALGAGGVSYTVGQASTTLYISSGSSKDWFYEQFTCASYTIELRDLNTFVLPTTQITPTQDESWAGFKSMVMNLNL